MVLNAAANPTAAGSRARMCSDADPSATSSIVILPPVKATGTVTSIAVASAMKRGATSSSSASSDPNGTASTTTGLCATAAALGTTPIGPAAAGHPATVSFP